LLLRLNKYLYVASSCRPDAKKYFQRYYPRLETVPSYETSSFGHNPGGQAKTAQPVTTLKPGECLGDQYSF
jgi:hypothetical protein